MPETEYEDKDTLQPFITITLDANIFRGCYCLCVNNNKQIFVAELEKNEEIYPFSGGNILLEVIPDLIKFLQDYYDSVSKYA